MTMEYIIAGLFVIYVVAFCGVLAVGLFGEWREKPQLTSLESFTVFLAAPISIPILAISGVILAVRIFRKRGENENES